MVNKNPPCPDCGTRQSVKHQKLKNGTQKYKCKGCGRTFSRPKTFFSYRFKSSDPRVNRAIIWTGKGFPLSLTARILDVKEDTVKGWLQKFGAKYSPYSRGMKALVKGAKLRAHEAERVCAYAGLGDKEQRRAAIAYSRKVQTVIQHGYTPTLEGVNRLPTEEAEELQRQYALAVAEIRGKAQKGSSSLAEPA